MAKERELPEVLEIPFVVCDNSVNRYAWRLLVEGIDLKGFKMNPVCCYQHDTYSLAIGKWKDLKVDNGRFVATVEFDRNDEDSVKLFWKYKDGFMNAVSLNILPLESSDDKKLLLPGQKYPTITKSELLEISLVTIPGQKYAVKLSTPEGGEYKLNLITNNIEKMTPEEEKKDKQNETEISDLKKEIAEKNKTLAANLVALHALRGVVQEEEKEHLLKLAQTDYGTTEKMLQARKTLTAEEIKSEGDEKLEGKELAAKLEEFTKGKEETKSLASEEKKSWTYYDWFKKDPDGLELMAKNEPDKFKTLATNYEVGASKQGFKI